jgi:hypothetical protein
MLSRGWDGRCIYGSDRRKVENWNVKDKWEALESQCKVFVVVHAMCGAFVESVDLVVAGLRNAHPDLLHVQCSDAVSTPPVSRSALFFGNMEDLRRDEGLGLGQC